LLLRLALALSLSPSLLCLAALRPSGACGSRRFGSENGPSQGSNGCGLWKNARKPKPSNANSIR
jgi:hypothetical protein